MYAMHCTHALYLALAVYFVVTVTYLVDTQRYILSYLWSLCLTKLQSLCLSCNNYRTCGNFCPRKMLPMAYTSCCNKHFANCASYATGSSELFNKTRMPTKKYWRNLWKFPPNKRLRIYGGTYTIVAGPTCQSQSIVQLFIVSFNILILKGAALP